MITTPAITTQTIAATGKTGASLLTAVVMTYGKKCHNALGNVGFGSMYRHYGLGHIYLFFFGNPEEPLSARGALVTITLHNL